MITDTRRAPRLQAPALIPVTDQMTGKVIGRLSNVSGTGMLLIVSEAMVEDALYQLQFPIPDGHGSQVDIDVGVHLLWRDPASAPEQSWAGFRFLTLSKEHREQLEHWIDSNLPAA